MNISLHSSCIMFMLFYANDLALKAQSVTSTNQPPKEHTIVIKQWSLPYEKTHPPFEVEYDGTVLHPDRMAINDLDNLKFEAGSLVKVVLPTTPMPDHTFFSKTVFLQHAIEDGAKLLFYQGEKQVHYHTLFIKNIRRGPISEADNLRGRINTDTATYILDGKTFFDGPSAVSELKKLSFEEKVVLVLYPENYVKVFHGLKDMDLSKMDSFVDRLMKQGVRFEHVGGVGVDGWPVPIYTK